MSIQCRNISFSRLFFFLSISRWDFLQHTFISKTLIIKATLVCTEPHPKKERKTQNSKKDHLLHQTYRPLAHPAKMMQLRTVTSWSLAALLLLALATQRLPLSHAVPLPVQATLQSSPDPSSTAEPSTAAPNTAEPNTVEPITAAPNTAEPSTVEPSTADTSTAAPSTTESSTPPSSCRTLKQRLQEYLPTSTFQYPVQYIQNAFSLQDLKLFDLLGDGRPNHNLDSSAGGTDSNDICERIVSHYKPERASSGNCHWRYNCTYSVDRFPSVRIEAIADGSLPYSCTKVRMEPVIYFQKKECLDNPGAQDWDIRVDQITVGFKDTA